MAEDYNKLFSIQKEYFNILNEIFERSLGCYYRKFCQIGDFDKTIKRISENQVSKIFEGLNWGYNKLIEFYNKNRIEPFHMSKEIGGVKLVLGGSSRFTPNKFNSIKRMLLYTDTILIPDPVLPWIEIQRKEERFASLHFLNNIFNLLHLKPLVDAKLQYPAVVVFPSWEKSLEKNDNYTQSAINNLTTLVFSYFFNREFPTIQDLMIFSNNEQNEFLEEVEKNNLFIAPGGKKDKLTESLNTYKKFIKEQRTGHFLDVTGNLPDGPLVLMGVMERLAAQFHLLENSESLEGQPMICEDTNWHYYKLICQLYEGRLSRLDILKPETAQTVRSLTESKFEWLGNIPIEDIKDLREENKNEEFRIKLKAYTDELYNSRIQDIDKVAGEVSKAINSLIKEHQVTLKGIQEEYNKKYRRTLVLSFITTAPIFMPALAPFFGVLAPLTVASKYALDKIDEIKDKQKQSKSLLGVLAKAKEVS